MKPFFSTLFLLLLIGSPTAFAQNYSVGTAVNELISTSNYASNGNCSPNDFDVMISFPASSITGIDNVLIINNLNSDTDVLLSSGDTLHIGDTLANINGDNNFTLFSSNGFIVDFELRAIGTPQIIGESFKCGDNTWYQTLAECSNSMVFDYLDNSSICFVSEALSGIQPYIDENFDLSDDDLLNMINDELSFTINLNNETSMLSVENPNNHPISDAYLIGLLGERIPLKVVDSKINCTDLSNSNLTMFYLEIQSNNKVFRKRLLKN